METDLLPAPDKTGILWGYIRAATGKTVIPPQYEQAGFFEDGLAIVRYAHWDDPHILPNGTRVFRSGEGVIDRTGKEILPPRYDAVRPARVGPVYGMSQHERLPDVFLIRHGEQYGYFHRDGRWLLPLGEYENIHANAEGSIRAGGQFFMDGKAYRPPAGYRITQHIPEAQAFFLENAHGNALPGKGAMSYDGKVLIEPKYDEIAWVGGKKVRWVVSKVDSGFVGRLLHAIRKQDERSVEAQLDEKEVLTVYLLDENFQEVGTHRARYTPFCRGREIHIQTSNDEKGSYILDADTGEIISDEAREKADRPVNENDDYRLFRERGFYGVKDVAGRIVAPPVYVSLYGLGGDLFAARKIEGLDAETAKETPLEYDFYATETMGVIDAQGRVILPFVYRTVEATRYPDSSRPLLLVGKTVTNAEGRGGLRYGLVDRKGKWIAPLHYESHFYLEKNGRAKVYKNGRYGVMDHTGKIVIPLAYRSIHEEPSRKAAQGTVLYIVQEEKLWGALDANGKKILPAEYGYVSTKDEEIPAGWIHLEDENRKYKGAYNRLTKLLIAPTVYGALRVHGELLSGWRQRDESNPREAYDLLDARGKVLGTYTRIEFSKENGGRFIVRKDEKEGLLDAQGRVLIPLKYARLDFASSPFFWAWEGYPKSSLRVLVDDKGKEYRIR